MEGFLSHVPTGNRGVRLKRQWAVKQATGILRTLALMALPAMVFAQGASAQPAETHADVELRGGAGMVCGWCRYRGELEETIKPTVNLFADVLFPVWRLEGGSFEVGPYAKGALLDGVKVPQGAAGLAFGYRTGNWELLGNVGFAYATERIGIVQGPGGYPGQTKTPTIWVPRSVTTWSAISFHSVISTTPTGRD
jgi:hypothetical protein